MSNVVIRCMGLVGDAIVTTLRSPAGLFCAEYDPDAHDGRGSVHWTADVNSAIQFPDTISAFRFYRQTSKLRPRREDGKPNRPLTAFSVEVIRIDDV